MLTAYENVSIIAGSAEDMTLATDSVDLIVTGNAFHRFPPEAPSELLRILKPLGYAAIISYTYTNTVLTDMLFGELAKLSHFSTQSKVNWHRLSTNRLFGDSPTDSLTYSQSVSVDWRAFWGAAQSGIEAPDAYNTEFEAFKAINRAVFDQFSVAGVIRMDYKTRVLFGQPKN